MVKLQERLKSLNHMLYCEHTRDKKDQKVIEILRAKISEVQLEIYKINDRIK